MQAVAQAQGMPVGKIPPEVDPGLEGLGMVHEKMKVIESCVKNQLLAKPVLIFNKTLKNKQVISL